jgi:hypothetical protein
MDRAAILIAAIVLSACTSAPSPRPIPATETPVAVRTIAELRAAVARWHRTPATITYRTERQRPGLAESAHQCLRAVVTDRTGIQAGLRMCDPGGVVTLAWDPPGRWRLDVAEGGITTTAIVVGRDGVMCERPYDAAVSCRPRAVEAILRDVPFRGLIAGVTSTLRIVGLGPEGTVTGTEVVVAGVPVRCFELRSGTSAARWCFAHEGALLSLRLLIEGRAPTIIEAARVSDEIDDTRFDPPG